MAMDSLVEEQDHPPEPHYHSDPSEQPNTVDDVVAMFTPDHFRCFFRFDPSVVKDLIRDLQIPEFIEGGPKK